MEANRFWCVPLTCCFCLAMGPLAVGQTAPWVFFEDALSDSACEIINTDNSELVLLNDTGQLVVVTGRDVILQDTFVDEEDNVFFNGDPVGFLSFEDDGDGLRSIWWVSLTGRVINVDGFTGEPVETDSFPADFVDVACDACEFWDDEFLCAELNDPINDPTTDPIDDPSLDTPADAPNLDFVVNLCGLNSGATMGMILFSLCGARWRRRSRQR
ncbi:MAG: hypothetical protein ACE5E5_12195 [Phycisphaerae bacterium]